MFRLFAICLSLGGVPLVLRAEAYDDLLKTKQAFRDARSWHADEQLPNGKNMQVDYSGPDRWRIVASPEMTEVLIGDELYVVRNGKTTKLPFGAGSIRKMMDNLSMSFDQDVKESVRDLGMQTVGGQNVHGYSFTSRGTPVTVYVGADQLPVESVVTGKQGPITIKYSKFNQPITISAG